MSIPAHDTHGTRIHFVGCYEFGLCAHPRFQLIITFFLWAILFHPFSLSEQVKNKDPLKIATKVTPPSSHSSTVALCPSIFPVIHRLLKLHPAAVSRGWYSLALLYLQQGATLNTSSLDQPTASPKVLLTCSVIIGSHFCLSSQIF